MISEPERSSQLEIAHVLFMDLVKWSLLPLQEQARIMERLQGLLRECPEFRRADACGELLRIPSGDGMALVFSRDPIAPLQCAIELARAAGPDLQIRMGLHSGPIFRVEDINANANAAGGGVNLAKRVVDCGDAGHILLSGTVFDLIGQVGGWNASIHDLGEVEVKHGVRIRLYNFHTDEVGNPNLPDQLKVSREAAGASRQEESLSSVEARPAGSVRVAILYRRNAQPDGRVMELLEKRLAEEGFSVFIDRRVAVGQEWAREIEREIRSADAVVPLLSTASIASEMLESELEIARDAARQNGGRPRLLPVRLNFTGPLPEAIGAILDPLQYALWEGPQDDEPLVAGLIKVMRIRPGEADDSSEPAARPKPVAAPRTHAFQGKLESAGGAVPLDSRFYVARSADDEFYAALSRRESLVLVKGSRQVGKTSLLIRGLQHVRGCGARVAFTDFQTLNASHLESPERFYLALAESLADQLDLDVWPEEVWNEKRQPNTNFESYLKKAVLAKIDEPLVWGLDEVDRLFRSSFGSEVFGLFRAWHNRRALDPTGPWSRLTLAIAYATQSHLLITDVNQSPFNVGKRLELRDFTVDQVEDLNERHGSPLRSDSEAARYFRLVNGHPYLVRRGLLEMVEHEAGIAEIERMAERDEGIFGDHLRRILMLLVQDEDLCDVVRGVLNGRPCPTPESFYRLRSSGVMSGESARDVHPRCELYARYLRRNLL